MAYVSLINSPSRASSTRPPISLMGLAAYLEKNDIDVNIIDIKTNPYKPFLVRDIQNRILEEIKRLKPKIVGMTCFTREFKEIIELSEKIKEEYDPKVIVGGVHATFCPEDFLYKDSPVDVVAIGEGEITLLELSQKILNNKKTDNIRGIAFLTNGSITRTQPRELIEDLDILPQLPWHLIDMNFYAKPSLGVIRYLPLSGINIFSGRGCPFNCKFCANPNLWKRKVRYRSVKKVVDEIEFLVNKYKIDSFYIYDDTFTLNKKRVLSFCSELKKRKLNIIWGCETRVNTIDEEIVIAMKDARCIQLDFGVESGSQNMLNKVSKGITVEQIKNTFRICKKYKLRTFNNFMFNLVDETEEDIEKTLNLVEELDADVNGVAIMTPYPGCELYERIRKLNKDEYHLYDDALIRLYPEFKFAKHDRDLGKLVDGLVREYRSIKYMTNFIKCNPYLKKILTSKRKSQYLREYVILLVKALRGGLKSWYFIYDKSKRNSTK